MYSPAPAIRKSQCHNVIRIHHRGHYHCGYARKKRAGRVCCRSACGRSGRGTPGPIRCIGGAPGRALREHVRTAAPDAGREAARGGGPFETRSWEVRPRWRRRPVSSSPCGSQSPSRRLARTSVCRRSRGRCGLDQQRQPVASPSVPVSARPPDRLDEARAEPPRSFHPGIPSVITSWDLHHSGTDVDGPVRVGIRAEGRGDWPLPLVAHDSGGRVAHRAARAASARSYYFPETDRPQRLLDRPPTGTHETTGKQRGSRH